MNSRLLPQNMKVELSACGSCIRISEIGSPFNLTVQLTGEDQMEVPFNEPDSDEEDDRGDLPRNYPKELDPINSTHGI